MADVPDCQYRPDVRPGLPLPQRRTGARALCRRSVHQRGRAVDVGAEPPAVASAVSRRRGIYDRRHRQLALGEERCELWPEHGELSPRVALDQSGLRTPCGEARIEGAREGGGMTAEIEVY